MDQSLEIRESGLVAFPHLDKLSSVLKYASTWTSGKVVAFTGTVKIDGANLGIVFWKNGLVTFQTRREVITQDKDFRGVVKILNKKDLSGLVTESFSEYFAVFGELAGNEKIVNAAGKVPMRFVVFAAAKDGEWLPEYVAPKIDDFIDDVHNYTQWVVEIDFDDPDQAKQEIMLATEEVSNACPYAHANGFSGKGEGIVWANADRSIVFKTKMDNSDRRVVEKDQVDSSAEEEFSIRVCGYDRFRSVFVPMFGDSTPSKSDIGRFVRAVVDDVMREESENMKDLDAKLVSGCVSRIASKYILDVIKESESQ